MEKRDRAAAVYFCVALAASLALGLAIAYLEVRRSQEVVQLEVRWLREVQRLQREVELLKEEVNNRTARINEKLVKLQSAPAGPPGEEDYYYDEEYEDDMDEGAAEEEPKAQDKRSRREVSGRSRISPALAPYNLIIRQPYKSQPNRTGPVEVKAKIYVNAENEEGYEVEPESYDRPQRPHKLSAGNVAVHYTGDTSRVKHARTHCYDVNHRMCHVEGIFRDWKAAPWSIEDGDNFKLRDGHLTVHRSPGIYYLYAQIFYADNHDTNGYRIFVNGHPTFQCTVTGLHDHKWIPSRVPYKRNSCYTGGLVHLNERDTITIREIDNLERYSVFEPYKSYFGLYKVASLPSSGSKR